MKWKPENTWVIYASLVEGHFNPEGRRDFEMVEAFKEAGIPEEQIYFLGDHKATADNMEKALAEVCESADEDSFLIYIYSGHGGLSNLDDGYTCYYALEGDRNYYSADVFKTLDSSFGGKFAWIISDCCYSGAATENAESYEGEVNIASLSSTAPFDSAWSGWLLIAQLIWLMEGRSFLDEDGDGKITLSDFCTFVETEMALVRHFRSSFFIPEGFEDFAFHSDVEETSHERERERVTAPRGDSWDYARILSVDEDEETAEVQWLDRYGNSTDTVKLKDCSPIEVKQLEAGDKVKVVKADQNNKEGAKGEVEEVFYGLHLVHFEGKETRQEEYDWLDYSKIKKI